jgi:two-component system chemotaxis response regulator CheY
MTRVLLLEDNIDMLQMLTQVLEWGGYEVITGRSGREGIALLDDADLPPDLIISDLLMPDIDGLAFLDHVRAHPTWGNMPFIMMSAHSSSQERQAAADHGADDFLVKPFNLDDFQRILSRWENQG